MSVLTKSGVCYALHRSPFATHRNGCNFYFSSLTHLNKFKREVRKKEEWLCDSFSRRFNVGLIDVNIIADIQLYQQVESRGFYITTTDGEVFSSWEEVKLGGLRLSKNAY